MSTNIVYFFPIRLNKTTNKNRNNNEIKKNKTKAISKNILMCLPFDGQFTGHTQRAHKELWAYIRQRCTENPNPKRKKKQSTFIWKWNWMEFHFQFIGWKFVFNVLFSVYFDGFRRVSGISLKRKLFSIFRVRVYLFIFRFLFGIGILIPQSARVKSLRWVMREEFR